MDRRTFLDSSTLLAGGARVSRVPGADLVADAAPKAAAAAQPNQTVKAAFQGGAHGVLLSRKYPEMRLDNIRGAGRAIRELKPG